MQNKTDTNNESAAGIVMMAFALLALVAANSPLSGIYHSIISPSVKHWVNDLLMVFFFLIIALELKREICEGFLSKTGQIMLPLAAAIGGMLVPALIFLGLNIDSPQTINGWAIPCATDIAFAVAILAILGKNIPPAARIFLLAVAIFDDLGAIIIITGFYNSGLAPIPLALAALCIIILIIMNRIKIKIVTPYILAGVALWFCFYYSGIHTTLAGVIVGLSIPMRSVNKTIHIMHPWVNFMVLPIFAFANSAVDFRGLDIDNFLEPLPLGIALGLFFGKQIGIFGAAFLLIKSKIVRIPEGATWLDIYSISVIAGIGFTMSLFIGNLAFSEPVLLEKVKIGVIGGLVLCIIWAAIILKITNRKRA